LRIYYNLNSPFNMSTESIFTVATALSGISVDKTMVSNLTKDNAQWMMFGKKDSHLLRAKLFKLFASKKLSKEAIFVTFFFFALIKNRNRVMDSFEHMEENIKSMKSVVDAKTFITEHIVQYTSQETPTRFAAVHLPTTMPGLDIMITALVCDNDLAEIENKIIPKQTFTQLNVNEVLQAKNKAGQMAFWNNVVKSSKNEARKNKSVDEELKFHEDYYNTSAADKYKLIDLTFKEINPKEPTVGYTEEEIIGWFKMIKEEQMKMIVAAGKVTA